MYAELKCKTNFSFLNGASSPDELILRAAEVGLNAISITDKNGVYAIPKAYWRAKDIPCLKLITGAEVTIQNHPPITLLAKTKKAYATLCQLLTKAHAEKTEAFLTLNELAQFTEHEEGLFCLSNPSSDFNFLKKCFQERLYFSLSRFKDGHDLIRTEYALEIKKTFGTEIVATNDVLYHAKERKKLQDVLSCIREGTSLDKAGFKLLPNAERYLKSPFEMKLLFKDLPEAITNTIKIADQCTFSVSELRYRYPSEWIPKEHSADSYLRELTKKGAKQRYNGIIPNEVQKQLDYELGLIAKLRFADYFLTIYDIVTFARSKKILCQGRGSAANSAVCFVIGITAIDPVKTNLLFERFISIERNEPPDIDVDFEHERREEVIQYIYTKYGRHRAGMVSAVITYQKRSAFREIAKAFAIPVGALSSKKLLRDFEQYENQSPIPHCKEQIEVLAKEMDGFPRHLSIHSGGFTLSADPITEIVPVQPARMEGRTIIQWDKYDLDYLGLLKIDVLALGMLSSLRKTLDLVGLNLHEIPQDDQKTYQMIHIADTVGTFQIESRAQMNMSGRLKPKNFYDLVVQVAIVRPGPSVGQMVHPYLKRRNGLEKPDYPHPKLKEILEKTLGVPLFQEQLMKIAIELGDFTPGEADQLRRAIGAWRASGSIQAIAEKLLIALRKKGIPEDYALKILEHMKGFAHYGFPESHAASFALLSYASCYLKRHHPAEFTCGLINSQPMGFYAVHTLVDDAKRHGVEILPIDPNFSHWDSTIEKQNGKSAIRLGLKLVHGISKKQADEILLHRPYLNLSEFIRKPKLKSDVLFRFAMGNALKCFGLDPRHTLWKILSDQIQSTQTQLDLFSGNAQLTIDKNLFDPLNQFEEVQQDYASFGLSAATHPMRALRQTLKLPKITTLEARQKPTRSFVRTSGLLLIRQKPPTAKGVCFGTIEDEFGFLDLVLFQKDFEKHKETFLNHCFLIVSGFIERDGNSISMIVKNVETVFKNTSHAQNLTIEPTQYFW